MRPSTARLAVAYAFGLVKNHPFLDGNKRTAAVVSELFLNLHNAQLTATDAQVVETIEGVAAGRVSEEELISSFESTHSSELLTSGLLRTAGRPVLNEL